MKKIVLTSVIVASILTLSSCGLSGEREDTMKLEGMMPKEDNKTIDAMMRKTEGDDAMMRQEEPAGDAMMKQ
jgi:hypothetical protein